MKKLLLGSTALVAAGVMAGGVAQAEDQPISVTVGGYYQNAFALIDQDSDDSEFADNTNSAALGQDVELSIGGSAVLDNGLTLGFKAMIEGNAGGDSSESLDERFVYFSGNFGQLRIGATESARQEFTNFAPGGAGIFGVNTPFFIFADPGNSSNIFNVHTYDDGLGQEDALKIVYFSPSFNGFSFALSWAPSDNTNAQYGNNARSGRTPGAGVGTLLDHLSAAVAINHDFGDFKIRVAGGYETYLLDKCNLNPTAQNCENEPDSWHAGGTVTFGKVSIGGGYLEGDLVNKTTPAAGAIGSTRERSDFDVGIAYWDAMWGVGLQYGRVEIDGPTDAAADDVEFDMIEVDGSYILGPGASVQAAIRFGSFENDAANSLDNDFTEVLLGSSFSF